MFRLQLDNPYRKNSNKPFIAPAVVVATDNLLARRAPVIEIQTHVTQVALAVAPHVLALHFDVNREDYTGRPDNSAVFSPEYLSALRLCLAESCKEVAPAIDLHFLGRDIGPFAYQYKGIADHVSLELAVVRGLADQRLFEDAVALLRFHNSSIGLIGVETSEVESDYVPYLNKVDVLGITSGKAALRTDQDTPLEEIIAKVNEGLAKVAALRSKGFDGPIIFQGNVVAATVPMIMAAGVRAMVCGSNIFNSDDPEVVKANIQSLNQQLKDGNQSN